MKKIVILTIITFLSLNIIALTSLAKDETDNNTSTESTWNGIDNNNPLQGSEMNDNIPSGDRPNDMLNSHDPVNSDPSGDLDGGLPSITPWSEF